MEKVEVGRVLGTPVVLDVTFIILTVLYGQSYFTSGDLQDISYGLLLVTGIALSILAHEFGHALAGRYYGVPASHVELNACGGLCHFERALPAERIPNIVVLLAGPAVTLALWLGCSTLGDLLLELPDSFAGIGGIDRLGGLIWHLGHINYWLLVFNLLPSHPLDGGRALAHILSRWLGYDRAMRLVAYSGFLVTAWVVSMGLAGAYYAFLIAFFLFQANQSVLDVHQGPRWRRWN